MTGALFSVYVWADADVEIDGAMPAATLRLTIAALAAPPPAPLLPRSSTATEIDARPLYPLVGTKLSPSNALFRFASVPDSATLLVPSPAIDASPAVEPIVSKP